WEPRKTRTWSTPPGSGRSSASTTSRRSWTSTSRGRTSRSRRRGTRSRRKGRRARESVRLLLPRCPSTDEAARVRLVLVEHLLGAGKAVFFGFRHHVEDDRGRAFERFVIALPLGGVDDGRLEARAHEEHVHEQARDFAAVVGEGEDAHQVVMG